jgi:hypothetical protein
MSQTIVELEKIMNEYFPLLLQVNEDSYSDKPLPNKWSKKEIMGHLIDSAENNIRRCIVAQYEDNPKIIYNQDKWVSISNYQQWNAKDIIDLWYLLNKQLRNILKNTSAEILQRNCETSETHTISWIAEDYIKHLLHHLHVVLDMEAVAYP